MNMISISEYLQDDIVSKNPNLFSLLEGKEDEIFTNNDLIRRYDSEGEKGLWSKIKRFGKKLGKKLLFGVLLLYYALVNMHDNTQSWGIVINKIKTALGYFIAPIDIIPDVIFGLGWVDDLIVVIATIDFISKHYKNAITDDVRRKAHEKFCEWFPEDIDDDIQTWKQEAEKLLN